jgi:ketosteroid isomerase-like protein
MMPLVLMLALALQSTGHDEIAVLRNQWARNLHDKLVEASVAEYAADSDFIDPGGNRVHGTVALRKLFRTITDTYDSDLVFQSQRVETSGDLTYDSGTFQETLITRATGKPQESTGSYLTVYRRSKDGGWLIVAQMWAAPPLEQGPK